MSQSTTCSTKRRRRAATRHAKPFEPEFPLTSLVYQNSDYYSQQLYAYWNDSFDGSFSGKTMFLNEINGKEIKDVALECLFQLSGGFTSINGPFCESKNDAKNDSTTVVNEVEKKERKYFWNEHLLFLKRIKPTYDDENNENDEEEVVALYQLCCCKGCIKKPGIPVKSVRPIRTVMCFSVSIRPNDPPRFANIPVILKPAVLTLKSDESPNSKLSKTGLISPQHLVYFTELPENPMGSLTMSQIAFDEKMTAKMVQLVETELMEWSTFEAEKYTLRPRHETLDVIPESPPMSAIVASDDESLIRSPPFTDLSALEVPSGLPDTSSPIQKGKGAEKPMGEERNEPQSQPFVMENLKSLATTSASTESIPVKRPSMCLKTMLEQEINTDWEIISTDGKVIKCHLAVLATQVPFFRSLSSSAGSQNVGEFAMPADTEMDEIAVKAFLRFIYFQDTELIKRSFQTCLTLLRSGHWHQLSSLVQATAEVIISRSRRLNHLGWFTVEGLWKLFAFVRSWEDEYPMKTDLMSSVVDVLKLLLVKTSRANGLLKLTNGDEALADLIYGFLTR